MANLTNVLAFSLVAKDLTMTEAEVDTEVMIAVDTEEGKSAAFDTS